MYLNSINLRPLVRRGHHYILGSNCHVSLGSLFLGLFPWQDKFGHLFSACVMSRGLLLFSLQGSC